MSWINESIGSFFDGLVRELQRLVSPEQAVTFSWKGDQPDAAAPNAAPSDLLWWSCALSVDPACRIYAGTDRKTWQEMSGVDAPAPGSEETGLGEPQESWFALLTMSIERASKVRFGALVSCTEHGVTGNTPDKWAGVSIVLNRGTDAVAGTISLLLSPDLVTALGGQTEENAVKTPDVSGPVADKSAPTALNALNILQHVEIPVSVSFGRTQMRLKDLLALANGSVVQLDRELGDEVEIRVNNCVIARGEVVAVDGNYGVRILKMASGENLSGQGVSGALRAG